MYCGEWYFCEFSVPIVCTLISYKTKYKNAVFLVLTSVGWYWRVLNERYLRVFVFIDVRLFVLFSNSVQNDLTDEETLKRMSITNIANLV